MEKYSLIRVLALIIIVIIFMIVGETQVYINPGDNLMRVMIDANKGKLIIIALVYIFFGLAAEKESKEVNTESVYDILVKLIYNLAAVISLPVGLMGLMGYLSPI